MANLIILILPIAAIFLMIRSQKKRQQQMQSLQSTLQAGAGVRTVAGMYAQVKAVNDETVELEIAPGVVAHYTKSAVAAVLEPHEYEAIINGTPAEDPLPEAEDAEEQPADAPAVVDADKSDKDVAEGEKAAEK